MNIKEIYPCFIEQQLKAEFGESYHQIRQAYKDNRIEEFLQEFLLNPATNYYASTTTPKQIEATAQRCISLFEWQKTKQIYKFDDELWSLIQNVDKLEIHCSVFQALPFQVFWIDHIFENGLNGCMVICNEDYIKLCFFAERNISYICLPFRDDVEGKTIEELIETNANISSANISSEMLNWYIKNIRSALNAIVYLCTDKPDISTYQTELPVSSVPKANKSNTKKKKAEKKKNVTSVSNVGLTIGRYIRETKRTVSSTHTGNGSGSGTPKAPHMRKAHYHSFWTKDGDKKKLIVKFLSPILVNGGKADDIQPTIRVRSKNEKNN